MASRDREVGVIYTVLSGFSSALAASDPSNHIQVALGAGLTVAEGIGALYFFARDVGDKITEAIKATKRG
jgi:hypothetical protein